jgi:imidazolonepropionase-like amidohydrolase
MQDWREQVEEGKDAPYDGFRKELPNVYRDFRQMHEEGVQFLAGTDSGVLFMYPGFSLHDELEKLVQAVGFTAMEALRIATDGVAMFYGETQSFGSVAPGQAADLVLLDADPLADIRNTRRIAGVLVRDRWFDRTELDLILRQVERSAQSDCHGALMTK